MILKKKPIKAQLGAALGTVFSGIKAGFQKGQNTSYFARDRKGKDRDDYLGMIGLDDITSNAYNANLVSDIQSQYGEGAPNANNAVKGRRTRKLFEDYEGDAFKTDEFGNLTANEDFLHDFYYRMNRNAGMGRKKSRRERDEQMEDFYSDYNKQYLGDWSGNQRALDAQASGGLASSAMTPFAKNGTKLVPKKCRGGKASCGGKLQKGAKLPKSVSKVAVDRNGPARSITKTTISGTGDGKQLKKKLGKFNSPGKPSKTLIRKGGGKLEEPGCVNVVVKGKLHKENNNLGNKDKGVPVVTPNGEKAYEVEKQEIIFRKPITQAIEKARDEYNNTKDEKVLIKLGKLLANELLNNTQDNDGKFGVKVGDEACELK